MEQTMTENGPEPFYEMAPIIDTSSPAPDTGSAELSASMAAMHAVQPQEGVNIQELPPVDRGMRAWMFCFSGFILEMMVWGFGFRLGLLQAATC